MALPIIKIENARGDVLNLTTDPRYEPILTGTGPVAATVNRSKVALADGTRFNSSTVGERNLLLTIYLKRDVARSRLNLYKYISPKEYIKIYYQADGLDVYIEGRVETAEVDPWTQMENLQASIICPLPFWQDVDETMVDASAVQTAFEFPFAIESEGIELSTVQFTNTTIIENTGTVETGIVFELVATLRSLQPRIYNLSTGKYIGFYVDMFPGDRLVVNTHIGQKSVTYIHDGVSENYINTVMEESEWLQMAIGANEYSYTVDEGEIELFIRHTNQYVGV